jgi:hypothetical protein
MKKIAMNAAAPDGAPPRRINDDLISLKRLSVQRSHDGKQLATYPGMR